MLLRKYLIRYQILKKELDNDDSMEKINNIFIEIENI